jgi:hypothetical protein
MTSDVSVRFWQPAPEVTTELVCACFEARGGPAHLHEEWQFGVQESASKLSLGAFRRCSAHPDDVTVVPPYEVHTEGVEVGSPPKWRMLYVASSMIRRMYGGKVPRLPRPVVTDRAAAIALGELLRRSGDDVIAGSEFVQRVAQWLQQFLLRHGEDAGVPRPMLAVERARSYLQNRPTQSVTMPEVGAIAGVTVSHLARSFSKAVGTPSQELPRAGASRPRAAAARRGEVGHLGGIRVRLRRSVASEPTVPDPLRSHARRIPGTVPREAGNGDGRGFGGAERGVSPLSAAPQRLLK